jgi:hypothetical protein
MDEIGKIDGIAGTESIIVLRIVKEDFAVRISLTNTDSA